MGSETEFNKVFTAQELSDYLKGIADYIIREPSERFEVDLGNFKEVKISIKSFDDQFEFKMKVKSQSRASVTDKTKKEKYSSLKKRMKSEFEMILDIVNNNVLPLEQVINKFLIDSEKMMTYPDKGGEDRFDEYRQACHAMKTAFENKDLNVFKEACKSVHGVRKTCHKLYK
jgi:XXXCH domain-containing protein